MFSDYILSIIIGIGVIHGLVFALYFFTLPRNRHSTANILFGLLIIAFIVRSSKYIIFYFAGGPVAVFANLGVAGHLAVGPLLYLYFSALGLEILNSNAFICYILFRLQSIFLALGSFLISQAPNG